MNKLVISYYKSESENYIMVFSPLKLAFIGLFAIAPYFIIASLLLKSEPSKLIVEPKKELSTVHINDSIKKVDVVKIAQSSIAKKTEFKVSDVSKNVDRNNVNVKFLLSKSKNDLTIKSGSINIIALDLNGNKLFESDKSIFKFQYSRISNFSIKDVSIDKVAKIEVKIKSDMSNTVESINLPLK